MQVCKNCGYSLENSNAVCPNCGYYPRRPRSRGSAPDWVLWILGFIAAFVANTFLPVIGGLIMLFVYFSIKEKYEVFAHGLGIGLITILVLLLGAIALCFVMVFGGMFGK